MEDQGKRLILAVALALGVWLAWSYFFPTEVKKPTPAATQADKKNEVAGSPVGRATGSAPPPAAGAAPAPTAAVPGAPDAAAPAPAPVPPVAIERGPEQEITLTGRGVRAVFTSWGGGLKSWRLLDKKYEAEASHGELVEHPPGSEPVVSMTVNFVGSPVVIPEKAEWQGEKVSDSEVVYRYQSEQLDVTKRFTFYPDSYMVRLVVEATPKVDASSARLAVTVFGYQDPKVDIKTGMGRRPRDWKGACYVVDDLKEISAKDLLEKGKSERTGGVRWGGFAHPFLLTVVAPRTEGAEAIGCNQYAVPKVPGLMQGDLVFPASNKPGPIKHEVVAYLGPKVYDSLKKTSGVAGFSTGFDKSVDLGFWAPIAKPLLWLLQRFYELVGNWGLAIVMLTLLVKLATLYWTTKSMRSMRAMADLKPKLDELQKKYADDRQRLQTEMMALYKEHGVNPLAGCLPMLLQMPIWLALYRMLSNAGELYLAPFIPGWIGDLTATDPYHVLPVVLLGAMFAQAKLSPTAVDSTQQKMLVYGMPIMFGVMGFFFPSGLSLYILTNTGLSAIHTLYMRRTGKPVASAPSAKVVAEAPSAPVADDGGKPASGGQGGGKGKRRRR